MKFQRVIAGSALVGSILAGPPLSESLPAQTIEEVKADCPKVVDELGEEYGSHYGVDPSTDSYFKMVGDIIMSACRTANSSGLIEARSLIELARDKMAVISPDLEATHPSGVESDGSFQRGDRDFGFIFKQNEKISNGSSSFYAVYDAKTDVLFDTKGPDQSLLSEGEILLHELVHVKRDKILDQNYNNINAIAKEELIAYRTEFSIASGIYGKSYDSLVNKYAKRVALFLQKGKGGVLEPFPDKILRKPLKNKHSVDELNHMRFLVNTSGIFKGFELAFKDQVRADNEITQWMIRAGFVATNMAQPKAT